MATRYNSLANTDRMALVALRARMELETTKHPDKIPSPESVLREVVNDAHLSHNGAVDESKVLRAFLTGK